MIVSAVVDPSCFGPGGVVDELTKRDAILFLDGIVQNGVLLDVPGRKLLSGALSAVGRVGTPLGQRVAGLLQELGTNHKRYIVCCDHPSLPGLQLRTVCDMCAALARLLQPDVIVTIPANVASIEQAVQHATPVLAVGNVDGSQYEMTRRALLHNAFPFDQLPPPEIEERIGRIVRYTHALRLYDYQMITTEGRARRFLDGIRFIVQLWERHCLVGAPRARCVELYTVGNKQTYTRQGFLSAQDAMARLQARIVAPLQVTVQAQVRGHVKEDSDGIFHPRGFEGKGRVFTLDPGFDAMDATGPIRRCLLQRGDTATEVHFAECRGLKDAR